MSALVVAITIVVILALAAGACMAHFFKYRLEYLFEGGGTASCLKERIEEYEALLKSLEKRGASASELAVIEGYIDGMLREINHDVR